MDDPLRFTSEERLLGLGSIAGFCLLVLGLFTPVPIGMIQVGVGATVLAIAALLVAYFRNMENWPEPYLGLALTTWAILLIVTLTGMVSRVLACWFGGACGTQMYTWISVGLFTSGATLWAGIIWYILQPIPETAENS